MKIVRSNIKITPYGGIVPVLKKIKEYGIPQVIRSVLGVRKKQSKFGYEDIFIAWMLTSFCGGVRLEHITKIKKSLNIIPDLRIPSHDTLGLVFKKLATETKVKRRISKDREAKITFSESNINEKLNEMLVKATKKIGILTEEKTYTLHIDATIIKTKCLDAKYTYERVYGFNPMICLIDDLPIYISMRNGNVSAMYEITQCLRECLDLLEKYNIKVGRVVSDSAGYNAEMLKFLDSRKIKFVVRPKFRLTEQQIKSALLECDNWRKTEIKTSNKIWDCEIGEVPYLMHGATKEFRAVTTRFPRTETIEENESPEEKTQRKSHEAKMKSLRERGVLKPLRGAGRGNTKGKKFEGHDYKFFYTNDYSLTQEQIVELFHKRGGEERRFDWMKNDFGWALPPFMRMNQNTVFMIAAALANNIFRGVVKILKKDIPKLDLKATLRRFIFEFIHVSCGFENGTYIFYDTDIAFEKIA